MWQLVAAIIAMTSPEPMAIGELTYSARFASATECQTFRESERGKAAMAPIEARLVEMSQHDHVEYRAVFECVDKSERGA